jgi:phosphodiesterase/alkaline phosphatase D-like protein
LFKKLGSLVLLVVASLLVTSFSISIAAPTHQEALPETLPNGVAAGDATQTSVVLWTHSTALGQVSFEYSLSADFAEIIGGAEAEVTDPLQPVKVLVEGLTAGTQYYYRATDSAGNSVSGSFRTPAEVGTTQGLRFGVSGDWRGELAPYPSITNIVERDLDFFVAQGDTIYSDYPSPDVDKPQAETLEEYRMKHNEVYATRYDLNAFAPVRSSTIWYATIDDHEVSNDFAGGATPGYDPRFADYAGNFVNETEIYLNGLQAFSEYNPLADELYGDTGDLRTANKVKLYRYRTFGSDAAIFVLDARSFRDVPLAPVQNLTDQGEVVGFLNKAYDAERTMLGRVQVEDLKADLLASHEAGIMWKFVIVPEPIQNFGSLYAEDRFEGYAAERTEILKFIADNGIKNVVLVYADINW